MLRRSSRPGVEVVLQRFVGDTELLGIVIGKARIRRESESEREYGWPEYHRVSAPVFVFFLGYIVYWYLQGGVRFPALGAIRFEFLMGAALFALAIPAYFTNPNRERSGVGVWVALLFALIVMMVWFSYAPEISYLVFIDRVVKFALLGFFIAAFVTTPSRLGWFIGAFLFACLKMGQEGFLGTITGSLIWENQGIPRLHGSTPNYTHPNSFSGMALGCLPFVLYFYRIVPWYLRLVLLIQLVFMLNIILFTGSRTGYVALIIGIGFLAWKAENRKRAFLVLLIAGFAAVPFIPQDYIGRARSVFTQEEVEGRSIEARKEILEDAVRIFVDNPLGVGVHAFPMVRQDRFGRSQDTHNLYLEVATNLGIQGLIVFSGFVLALLRILSRLAVSIDRQIKLVEQVLSRPPPASENINCLRGHLRDLQVMRATCRAVYVFLIIRLGLGLFGMDLYEIYWWFALGTTVAIWNVNVVARRRTDMLRDSADLIEGECSEVGTAAVRSISEPTKDLSVSASSIFSSRRGADG